MHILILAAAFIVASADSVRIVLATMSFLFMKQLFGNSGLLESVELLLEDLLVAIDNLGSLLLVDDKTFVNLKNKHKFELI